MTRDSYQRWYELHSYYRLFPSTNIIIRKTTIKFYLEFYRPVLKKPIRRRRVLSELKDHYSLLLNVMMICIKETVLYLGD